MSVVVGLDIAAYKSGYAVGNLDTYIISEAGRIEAPTTLPDKERSRIIYRTIVHLLARVRPSIVLIEDTRISFGRNTGNQSYYTAKNMGVIEHYCDEKRYECIFIPIATWKAKLFGKGWSKTFKDQGLDPKKESKRVIQMLYPNLIIDTDDAAEAAALIHSKFKR